MSAAQPDAPQAPRHTNALARESSPYLRQHAHNPVDWRPWGEEAIEEARKRQVPIFLSVGYSTCYWCHVMERECFEDEAIARLLSESFVCVKVDREERPDVDDIYMTAVQMLTRRGGWPMSVWLLPPPPADATNPGYAGLEPFYAGTYFPPRPMSGMPGLPQVVSNINEAWKSDRPGVIEQAKEVAAAIRENNQPAIPVRVGQPQFAQALNALLTIHDAKHGGFGRAPKFPQPVFVDYLLELTGRISDPAVSGAVSAAVRLTLDRMALGGMNDQLAGGFHRYSTDETWTVPHFEKMLYDNALLTSLYARSYTLTRDPFDALVARTTAQFVLREMIDKETGAFYSAIDAEVDGREGFNYLWTRAQLTEALGEDDAVFAARILGFDAGTNFQDPHHPDDIRRNVLLLPARPEKLAEESGLAPDAFGKRWALVQQRLLAERAKRKGPSTDDKVITAWNGLMIGALADAALALGDLTLLDAAERASKFFLVNMRTKTGGLFRTYRDTKAKTAGFLEDYAFVVQGLIKVHLASAASGRADTRYLSGAEELTKIALERFGADAGGLYDTRDAQPDLIVRAHNFHDGAMPSAPGVMLHNLIDLYLITRNDAYTARAAELASFMSGEIARSPLATVNATRAVLRLTSIKPGILDHLPEAPAAAAPEQPEDQPIQVLADTDRVIVPATGEAALRLKISIDEGVHINASDPGVAGMTGLSVRVVGGTGVAARLEEPRPQAYQGGALPKGEGPLMVHEGEVELTLRLSRSKDAWQGRPMLVLTYQACTDTACLKPAEVSLDVALDPAAP